MGAVHTIKPFAIFTSILLIDARAQLLRAPEAVFAHSEFLYTDTISSHDTMIQKGLYIIALHGTKSSPDTGGPPVMVQKLKAGAGNYVKECNSCWTRAAWVYWWPCCILTSRTRAICGS